MPHREKIHVPPSHTTELHKDFSDSLGFESILNLMNSSATVTPPLGFTPKVMHRLSELDIDPRRSSDRNSLNDRLQGAFEYLTSPATAIEMATCFFLSGFFYLVLGISLHLGLDIYIDFTDTILIILLTSLYKNLVLIGQKKLCKII